MEKKNLTTWEAACIITGYGVGGGVMSMPYLADKAGFVPALVILAVAFVASYILHLMIADVTLKSSSGGQLISCLTQFLFRGRFKKLLSTAFFALMLLILFANLAGYITGAEEIIVGLLPVSNMAAKLMFYAAAAVVVLLGLKAVGISEKYAVALIFVCAGTLAVLSFFAPQHKMRVVKTLHFQGFCHSQNCICSLFVA